MITNNVNNKRYVGKSVQPTRRWLGHKSYARRGDLRRLYCSMRKHGVEQFKFEILTWCDSEDAAFLEEKRIVTEWNLCDPRVGYNLTSGGRGGCRVSDQVRHRMKLREPSMKGRKHTEETKRLLSIDSSGANNANFGKHKSDETKQKMSDSQKGRKFTDDHREKLRQAKLGKKTGRSIPPEMAIARRNMKGTIEAKEAAKLGWITRRAKINDDTVNQ